MKLVCRNITKAYIAGRPVLKGVNLDVNAGQKHLLIGPSGSGKTTLLTILGCMSTPCSGEMLVDGITVSNASARTLEQLRRQHVGFVFQHARLLPFLTARDNVVEVAINAGMSRRQSTERAYSLFSQLGIDAVADRLPVHLSGGERQRVAIARAMVHSPDIILADEPTASLDWVTAQHVMEMLVEQTAKHNTALITVTHDLRLKPWFDRVHIICDGGLTLDDH